MPGPMRHLVLRPAPFVFALTAAIAPALASASPGPAPIVGGGPAPAGQWPDTVAVLSNSGACTGTLIAPDVVLTAGHCIDIAPNLVIANTLDYEGNGGERLSVQRAVAYPNWENTYDVGVLVLTRAATTPPRAVASSCVFEQQFADGASVQLVGFGTTDPQGQTNNSRLNQVSVTVTDPACTGGDGCVGAVSPGGEFVAGGGGCDSCYGDSGGPVYRTTPWGTYVVGVVSRGVDSAQDCGGGGIYVRTDAVLSWIEQTTGRTLVKSTCQAVTDPEEPADPEEPVDPDAPGEPADPTPGDDAAPQEIVGGCQAGVGATGPLALSLVALVGTLGRRRRRRR